MRVIYCHHAQRDRDKSKPRELWQEDDITQLGEEDARIYAKMLAQYNIKITAVYTSPFLRCKRTAQVIGGSFGAPIYEEERFNEFKSFENESWTDCLNRIISAINDITNKHEEEDVILCVTSGVNISGFVCWAYDIEPSESTPFPMVISCSPVAFDYHKENRKKEIDDLFK